MAYSKRQRKSLYRWASRLKGKGQLSRIGKKMKSIKRKGGSGSKTAIRQLGEISSNKKAFLDGLAAGRRSRGRRTYKKRTYRTRRY